MESAAYEKHAKTKSGQMENSINILSLIAQCHDAHQEHLLDEEANLQVETNCIHNNPRPQTSCVQSSSKYVFIRQSWCIRPNPEDLINWKPDDQKSDQTTEYIENHRTKFYHTTKLRRSSKYLVHNLPLTPIKLNSVLGFICSALVCLRPSGLPTLSIFQ